MFTNSFSFQFPALSDGNVYLWGLAATIMFVSPASLKGSNDVEKAQVLQWLNIAEHELMPAVLALVDPKVPKASVSRARQEVQSYLDALNRILLYQTYLVGESVTLADLAMSCSLQMAFCKVLDGPARAQTANTVRWFNTILLQPNVKQVLGNFTLFDGKMKN